MASRKEEKERRRQERLAREQTEEEQARRKRLYGLAAAGVLALAAIVAVVIVVAAGGGGGATKPSATKPQSKARDAVAPPEPRITNLAKAAQAADCELRNPSIEGNTHLSPGARAPKYGTSPPTSGNHDPVPADDGAYERSPGITHLLHSLEHGRVEIHYKPSLPRRRAQQVKGLFNEDSYHMILTPNDSMPFQVAAAAWGHLAGCKKVSDSAFDVLRAFKQRYRDKGPEFVP